MKRPVSLKARALRYLATREHSRKELVAKLQRHAEDGESVDRLMGWLEENGFLSNERFAESLLRRRKGRYGNARILHEMREHGVADLLHAGLDERLEDEPERAFEVLTKKFDSPPDDAQTRARQIRFLQQRGFSMSAINSALKKQKAEHV